MPQPLALPGPLGVQLPCLPLPSPLRVELEKLQTLAITHPISRDSPRSRSGCLIQLCPLVPAQPPAPSELPRPVSLLQRPTVTPETSVILPNGHWFISGAGLPPDCEINGLIPVAPGCVHCGVSAPCAPTHRHPAALTLSLTVVFMCPLTCLLCFLGSLGWRCLLFPQGPQNQVGKGVQRWQPGPPAPG